MSDGTSSLVKPTANLRWNAEVLEQEFVILTDVGSYTEWRPIPRSSQIATDPEAQNG